MSFGKIYSAPICLRFYLTFTVTLLNNTIVETVTTLKEIAKGTYTDLKNLDDENQATIQVLKEEVKDLKNELNVTKIDTDSHDLRLEELEEKLIRLDTTKVSEHCIYKLENYHFIDDRCFYFETRMFNYENAQQNCANRFSSGGKMFEPFSKSINDRVYGEFKEITGKEDWVWVGVIDKENEGSAGVDYSGFPVFKENEVVFRYASSGVPVSNHMTIPWRNGEPYKGRSHNCVTVHTGPSNFHFLKWMSYQCYPYELMSVCERA